MRFICLLLAFLSVIISVFLGFVIYSETTATEKYEKGIADTITVEAVYKDETAAIKDDIAALWNEKSELEAKIASAEKLNEYKTKPVCFLTFDDGPNANALKILDILNENSVKGTFFVVGSNLTGATNLSAIQRMADEGHIIAIHADKHVYEDIYSSKAAYFEDLDAITDKLQTLIGKVPDLVRMPGGTASAYDFFGKYAGDSQIYYNVLEDLEYRGITVVDWNVDTRDFTTATGVNGIIENAVDGAMARQTGYKYKAVIILMHCNKDTVTALPEMIKQLKEKGFSFEGLTSDGYIYRQK